MDLSRALAVAASGIDVRPERLRAIARALDQDRCRSAAPGPAATPAARGGAAGARDPWNGAQRRQSNLLAMQAARSLLVRTIALLK